MNRKAKTPEIDTPYLRIDLDKFEKNIRTMAEFFAPLETSLRPHFKTNKCPRIAQRQIEAGAIGITCAKLGEAEVLVKDGITDILIANQIVGQQKIRRLIALADKAQITVAVDNISNLYNINVMAESSGVLVGVLVEVNVGLNRCGIEPGVEVIKLAKEADSLKGIKFEGLMGYEGHIVHEIDRSIREKEARKSIETLIQCKNDVEKAGIKVNELSGGGTGTYDIYADYPDITEVQAGSYVFMDAEYDTLDLPFEKSLTIVSTVISTPRPGVAIIDTGRKTLTTDGGLPQTADSDLVLKNLNEEHGIIEDRKGKLKIGDRITIYPSHCCTTVNQNDRYICIRGNDVEDIWEISARGKSQ